MPGPWRSKSWLAKNSNLYTPVRQFRQSSATDSRHMIYALLGLSRNKQDKDTIVVDYAKPLHKVYQDVLQYFIQSKDSGVDRVLNIAAATPGIAAVLIIVQDGTYTESEVEVFNCKTKKLETALDTSQYWLRSTSSKALSVRAGTDSHDISAVAISQYNAHMITQQLSGLGGPEASLYSETLSILSGGAPGDGVKDHGPDVGHRGDRRKHVKRLVLEVPQIHQTFMFAVRKGFFNMIDMLLDLELLDMRRLRHSTALHTAVDCDNEAIVLKLLNLGFDPNALHRARGPRYDTPLYRATEKRHCVIMKILIEHGANLNIDIGEASLLCRAIEISRAAFGVLIAYGADCKRDKMALMTAMCWVDAWEWALEPLLEHGADANFALHFEMRSDRPQTSTVLAALKYGANPNLLATPGENHWRRHEEHYADADVGKSMLQLAAQVKPVKVIGSPHRHIATPRL